jgi:SH3-like domain-containing protein
VKEEVIPEPKKRTTLTTTYTYDTRKPFEEKPVQKVVEVKKTTINTRKPFEEKPVPKVVEVKKTEINTRKPFEERPVPKVVEVKKTEINTRKPFDEKPVQKVVEVKKTEINTRKPFEEKPVPKVVEVKKTEINNVYKAPNNQRVVKEEKIEKKFEKKIEDVPYAPREKEIKYKVEEKIEKRIPENQENLENPDDAEQIEKLDRLKVALNEIERVNASRTLKSDLVELYEKVLEFNKNFKDDIFFKNLNDTHRKVGSMDKRKIPHTYREIETSKVLKNHENAQDLLRKYTYRAKRIVDED